MQIAKLFILIVFIFLASCNAEKYLIEGNYEHALETSLKKFEKNPSDYHSLDIAVEAYKMLNEQNLIAIEKLNTEKKESTIDQVYSNYFQLYKRSFLLKPYTSDLKNIEFIDYKDKVDETAKKAGEYHYSYGKKLLESGIKKDAQKGYEEFKLVKKYNLVKDDLLELTAEAKQHGTVHVVISTESNSKYPIPVSFENELLNLNLNKFNSKWVQFSTKYLPGNQYDYSIKIILDKYSVSGDERKKRVYTEKKEIIEKYVVKKDSKGKIVKNEKGEIVKIPVKKEVKATITEIQKRKRTNAYGQIKFTDNTTLNTFKTLDLNAEFQFENISGTYKGNKDALTANSLKLVKLKEVPFPNQEAMLFKVAQQLRLKSQRAIHSQLNYMK